MTETNECYAYFHIAGSFDPAAITADVGVAPTKACIEGELISATQKRRTCSRWMLYSRLARSAALEEHVSDVLDQLDSNESGFRRLSTQHGGTMELVGYFRDYPGIFFEYETIKRLAQYALSLDCDFYVRSDAEGASPGLTAEPE
jgi:hypothetical protein